MTDDIATLKAELVKKDEEILALQGEIDAIRAVTEETMGCFAMEIVQQDKEIMALKEANAKLFMVGRLA